MRELLQFCWNSITSKKRCIGYGIARVSKALADIVAPFIVGFIINSLVAGVAIQSLVMWCMAVAVLGVASALLDYFANYTYSKLQSGSSYQLEKQSIDHVWHWRQDCYATFEPAEYQRRVNNDTNDTSIFFLMSCAKFLVSVGTIAALMIVLLSINVVVALLCGVLTVVSGLGYLHFRNEVFRKNLQYKQAFARYATCELSQYADVTFIRRHNLFGRYSQALDRSYEGVRSGYIQNNEVVARLTSANAAMCACLQAVMLLAAAWQIAIGNMQVGYLATVSSYFSMLVSTVEYFTEFGIEYQACKASYGRLREIAQMPKEPNGSQAIQDVSALGCKDLTFAYPGKDVATIRDLNAEFTPGHLWAIAGHNGCGKSTLMKLLDAEWAGLYQGSIEYLPAGPKGTACVEQANVDHYALRRDVIGYTEQEPPVVEDTLLNNLTLMCQEQPPRERVMELVRLLGLEHLLSTCPDGLDTVLDDSRPALSGGEKQKVAIIRMLLADPKVMLLDEPTSALDAQSVDALVQLLRQKSRDRIVIVVTHDQKLLDACDEVLRLG
ncbi:MAG: ATP-binding cassette domain-containing protein [Atopobiaceae bacterium]